MPRAVIVYAAFTLFSASLRQTRNASVPRGSWGLDMTAARCKAHRRGSHVDHVAVVDEAVSTPLSRRARLMGATALAGGALRGLAIAAGIVTLFGGAPALAQCFSGTGGTLLSAACNVTAATGADSTVGFLQSRPPARAAHRVE